MRIFLKNSKFPKIGQEKTELLISKPVLHHTSPPRGRMEHLNTAL